MLFEDEFIPVDGGEDHASPASSLPALPSFSGAGRGISVNRFVEKLEARIALCKWDTQQVRCVLLELLQGPALQAYREMTKTQKGNPEEVFVKLKELFGNATHQRQLARSAFQAATQRESETVVQFYWRLKGLLQSGYSDLSSSDADTRMHEKLLGSMLPKYQYMINCLPHDTVEEVMSLAKRLELSSLRGPTEIVNAMGMTPANATQSDKVSAETAVEYPNVKKGESGVTDRISEMQTRLLSIEEKLNQMSLATVEPAKRHTNNHPQQKRQQNAQKVKPDAAFHSNMVSRNQSLKPKVTCFHCGKVGHVIAQCYAKQETQTRPMCGFCGKPGHVASSCFHNPEAQRPSNVNIICAYCGARGHPALQCRTYGANLRQSNIPSSAPINSGSIPQLGNFPPTV